MSDAFPLITRKDIGGELVETVDGRELHAAIKAETQFRDWAPRRIEICGFEEGVDYVRFEEVRRSKMSGKGSRQRTSVEYAFTLDAAKHIAMVERNPEGRRVRDFFIQRDKELRELETGAIGSPIEKMRSLDGGGMLRLLEMVAQNAGSQAFLNVWKDLGLTDLGAQPTNVPLNIEGEMFAALAHLLCFKTVLKTTRNAIASAAAGSMADYRNLQRLGIVVQPPSFEYGAGITLWPHGKGLRLIFGATRWADTWDSLLLKLPGAQALDVQDSITNAARGRGVLFLPMSLLYDGRLGGWSPGALTA